MITEKVDIIIGGSPCQSFSIAGKQEGFEGKSGLFWEYIRLYKLFKPTYFLLENVTMKKEWETIINDALGVDPIRINSSLVSAQNRDRLYWTNIPGVTVPEDRKIMMSDIIPDAIGGYGRRGTPDGMGGFTNSKWTTRKDGKSNCLTRSGGCDLVTLGNGESRPLTIDEQEMLQTLPAGYTDVPGLSKTAKREAIGNSWTLEVIKHIFNFLPK
jgi:DNA (cytosine-5)-methyltransferase 3A